MELVTRSLWLEVCGLSRVLRVATCRGSTPISGRDALPVRFAHLARTGGIW